jgi:RNA polymerase sigma-70 factor, ECF subfamily
MEHTPADDLLAMSRLRDGDDLALSDLMRRWKEPLVSYCWRIVGHTGDAHDLAQETFVKIYQARHRHRPEAAFSTWMFAIATNLCRQQLRWRRRHPEQTLEGLDDTPVPAPVSADPARNADRAGLAADLEEAIQELPADLRIAFVLTEWQGLSHREAGVILRCSAKAIERRAARAREALRAGLASRWGDH